MIVLNLVTPKAAAVYENSGKRHAEMGLLNIPVRLKQHNKV
jgi:hypothetical protein